VKTLTFAAYVGTTTEAQDVQVENIGCATAGTPSIAVTGANAADFATTTTCTSPLVGDATCSVGVSVSPSVNGAETAILTVPAIPGGTETVSLAETGLCPAQVTVTPTSGAFGSSPVGSPTAAQLFTVTNSGGETIGPISAGISGADAADFAIGAVGTCGPALTGGKSCSIDVTFTPSLNGNESATLTVEANPGATTPITVPLTGIGTQAALTVNPGNFSFGAIPVGTTVAETFIVTNSGTATSGVPALTLDGGQAALFAVVTDGGESCTAAIGPGDSCSVQVTFTPTSAGLDTAQLDVTANPGGFAQATLSGTGS
jgi:hypothetical protein